VEILETIVNFGNKYVWGFPEQLPWLVVLLLAAGFYVTLRLAFIQFRHLGHAIKVVLGRYDDPDDPGDVNHFQALSTALSATVGIGNIAGVATAIHYGGPGAVFWMWVTAAFGMGLKYAECTLSLYYRSFDDDGHAAGGPMYYIERGLGKRWKPLAILFAVCAIVSSFGGGNMNQANTVAVSATTELGVSTMVVGVILAAIVGVVILGGIRSIAAVASKLAPSMAVLYVLGALVILAMNAGEIPEAFGTIFTQAFNPRAGVGGSAAGLFSLTLLWGVKRGLFSNEAGQGSAPIAHAAAKTNEPVREGAVAMLGPLIDTLIICTMTALVIVITGVWDKKKEVTVDAADITIIAEAEGSAGTVELAAKDGVQERIWFKHNDGPVDEAVILIDDKPYTGKLQWHPDDGLSAPGAGTDSTLEIRGLALQNSSALTTWGFQEGLSPLGGWGGWVVTICVFLFAISTMISWSYYGDRCVVYLFGTRWVIVYRLAFIFFVFLGSVLTLEVVWAYGDLALGLMTVPNLLAVVLLMPKIRELTREYFVRMKEGAIPEAKAKEVDGD
jgi:AGCS family alanine or glycine:cation symporter